MQLFVYITADVLGQPPRKETIIITAKTNPETIPLRRIPKNLRKDLRTQIKSLVHTATPAPGGSTRHLNL